jgi:hypothetical protein
VRTPVIALAIAGLALLPCVAWASADSDAVVQFGLVGSWALNCQAPPSPANPFTSFDPSTTGIPVRQIVTGQPQYDSHVPVSQVTLIGTARLQLSYPQGGVTVTVVLEKEDKGQNQRRIRPVDAVASNGTVSVKDGIVSYSGQPTAWLNKCAD